jgi:hypothetical protein
MAILGTNCGNSEINRYNDSIISAMQVKEMSWYSDNGVHVGGDYIISLGCDFGNLRICFI